LGDIFLKEMKPKIGNSLITVTKVRVTSDLSIARVYISIFPVGDMPVTHGSPMHPAKETNSQPQKATTQLVIDAILTHAADIRRRLGLREGKQLRIIPNLEFYLDDTLDYIENIEKLLKN
jgi:ribosome-binding factor A